MLPVTASERLETIAVISRMTFGEASSVWEFAPWIDGFCNVTPADWSKKRRPIRYASKVVALANENSAQPKEK